MELSGSAKMELTQCLLCTSNIFFQQSKFSSTGIIFIHGLLFLSGFFLQAIFLQTFPKFVKLKHIFRTWQMNLLFSRTCGNPA